MPVHIVPKPNSSDFCMVTDHSLCPDLLNTMISHDDITSYPLDNLKHLGEVLLAFHQTIKSIESLVVFKSNVSKVYCLLPVHKKWQIKQIDTVNGLHYVDHCNMFGNHASGSIWISFNALVLWIAQYIHNIQKLLAYFNDVGQILQQDLE